MDKVKAYVAYGFSGVVVLLVLFSAFSAFYLRLKNPQADITMWSDIILACIGYIVGILAALFGIQPSTSSTEKTLLH